MKTGTKLGIIGFVIGTAIQITFGIIEVKDRRKGRTKLNKDELVLVSEATCAYLDATKKVKKNVSKTVEKEESKKEN